MSQKPELQTDHLVYAVPDLATAADQIEAVWGVRPRMGGQHPNGTHNALLALGPHTYLEIIAPDPQQPEAHGRSFGLDSTPSSPRLVTWAVATGDLDRTLKTARDAGYDPGEVSAGGRRRPDGVQLAWRSTRLAEWPPPGDGIIPFLIEWGAWGTTPVHRFTPGLSLDCATRRTSRTQSDSSTVFGPGSRDHSHKGVFTCTDSYDRNATWRETASLIRQ